MRILVAPNSMKGGIDAFRFADIVTAAFQSVSSAFEIRKLPVADGGDYTGPVLSRALNALPVKVMAEDPLGRSTEALYYRTDDMAIIEMAAASGLRLLTTIEADPWRATSAGTGTLIQHARKSGCSQILLGVGGSATVDGGIGMLGKLGFTFADIDGNQLPAIPASLQHVKQIVSPPDLDDFPKIRILCDVNNPLLGVSGAARVFGPQKGADPDCVRRLEAGLENWIQLLENPGRQSLQSVEGMGAAGGIASGLVALLGAEIKMGASTILDILQFESHLSWCDLVITGEGKADAQSLSLKAPVAVAERAKRAGKPVIAIAGEYDPHVKYPFNAVFSIASGPASLGHLMSNTPALLHSVSVQLAEILSLLK